MSIDSGEGGVLQKKNQKSKALYACELSNCQCVVYLTGLKMQDDNECDLLYANHLIDFVRAD